MSNVGKNKKLTVLTITNKDLKAKSATPKKGFGAVLRVLVNEDLKEVLVQNPEYFLRAFHQKDYDEKLAKATINSLKNSLGELKNSADILESDKLTDYHFMVGMPYYQDFIEIKTGINSDLLKSLEYGAGKNFLFSLKLSENSYLVGVGLEKRVEKFTKKIGKKNSVLLPYTVLIEDGKAYILHPKFYIALSYPLLTMGEFMTIASVPGKIEDKVSSYFK